MRQGDIAHVLEVDRVSYPLPWPSSAYRRELSNTQARYIVLRQIQPSGEPEPHETPSTAPEKRTWRALFPWVRTPEQSTSRAGRPIVGYAGMWIVADEAHVTTIAVEPARRRKGLGELLLVTLIGMAAADGVRWVTLEVRASNQAAQQLYRKYGFRKAGVRRRYYSDNNEDALIMTTDDISLNVYQAQFADLKRSLTERLLSEEAEVATASV